MSRRLINLLSEHGCSAYPSSNLPEYKSGIYCNKHKKNDMINVITKECIEYGRNVQALYNFSEYSVRLYCSKH